MGNMSIRRQILALGIGSMLAVGLVAMVAFIMLNRQVEHYQHLLDEQYAVALEADKTVLAFKRQVQEWKNVLLRGHDASNLNKYWGRFEEHQRDIQSSAIAIANSDVPPQARAKIQAFQAEHKAIFSKYQSGKQAFISSGYDHKAGDRAVSGIDRQPTKDLEEASEIITAAANDKAKQLAATTKTVFFTAGAALVSMMILVALAAAYIGSNKIAKPISEMVRHLDLLVRGNFSSRVDYWGQDEMGRMADGIRTLQAKLQGSTDKLSAVTNSLHAASESMEGVAKSIQTGTTSQYSRTEHSASAMTELSCTAKEVAKHASDAKRLSDQADEAAVDGEKVMNEAISTMHQMKDQIANTAGVIMSLEEDTSEVGKVLDVIRGIAEQTNLLALNAAIEAARAGEQGRGFAVVADEVRTLAQRTQESTAEIHQMIVNVQSGAHGAVSAIEAGGAQSEDTMDKLTKAGAKLQDIRHCIDQMTGVNQLIASAAQEQAHVSEDITQAITDIANIANDSAKQAGEVSAMTATMRKSCDELQLVVAELKS